MEALQDFPEEYAKSFQTSFDLLKNFNIRYLENKQPFLTKNYHFFYIAPAVSIHILALGVHMTVLLSREDISQAAYLLPPLLVTIHATFKALVLIPKTSDVSALIKELGALWRTEFTESQSKEKNALLSQLNLFNRAMYWVTVCGSGQYLLSPILETLVRRFILQQDSELLLPIASSYPFNPVKNWLIYIPVYVFQSCTMVILVSVYMGAELVMITLCALLGTEFLMLKDDLAEVKPRSERSRNHTSTENENEEHCIENFVKRHQKLIRLSRQLDNAFNQMIFIDLLFVGITTCAFSFAGEFSRGPTYMLNNYVAVFSSMLTVLYLCYFGELLTGASARIGDLAYQNLWYKGGKQYKVAIWLIIKISQNPCCVTSLRYSVVSLNMFTKVVSTTWSYFSLMNSVYSEEE